MCGWVIECGTQGKKDEMKEEKDRKEEEESSLTKQRELSSTRSGISRNVQ